MSAMRLPARLLKPMAAGLSGVVFLTNCLLANVPESNFWAERHKNLEKFQDKNPLLLAQLPQPGPEISGPESLITRPTNLPSYIPRELTLKFAPLLAALSPALGHVQGIVLPASGVPRNVVIHIQDVHMHAEAQAHIGQVLQELINQRQAGLVALEGGFGPIDVDGLRSLPDKATLRKVSDYLLQQNEITGPLHTALVSPAAIPPFIGVDDKALYRANVEAYRLSAPRVATAERKLTAQAADLSRRKAVAFAPDLTAFDDRVQAYHAGRLPLADYLSGLAGNRRTDAPNVAAFLRALRLEASMDFALVERERAEILRALADRLEPGEAEGLVRMTAAFHLGRARHKIFYGYLQNLCRSKGVPLEKYTAMADYMRYVLLADSLDAAALFQEMERLEDAGYAALARSPEQKELINESRRLRLCEKLLTFTLTPLEWEKYKKETAGRARPELTSFEDFYRRAEARNQDMADKLLAAMAKNDVRTAVLVTGGFHASGIDENLKRAGVAVVSYVPAISKVETENGAAYLSVFTREKTPLQKLFKGNTLFLPAPVYSEEKPLTVALPYDASKIFDGQAPNLLALLRSAAPNLRLTWAEVHRKGNNFFFSLRGRKLNGEVKVVLDGQGRFEFRNAAEPVPSNGASLRQRLRASWDPSSEKGFVKRFLALDFLMNFSFWITIWQPFLYSLDRFSYQKIGGLFGGVELASVGAAWLASYFIADRLGKQAAFKTVVTLKIISGTFLAGLIFLFPYLNNFMLGLLILCVAFTSVFKLRFVGGTMRAFLSERLEEFHGQGTEKFRETYQRLRGWTSFIQQSLGFLLGGAVAWVAYDYGYGWTLPIYFALTGLSLWAMANLGESAKPARAFVSSARPTTRVKFRWSGSLPRVVEVTRGVLVRNTVLSLMVLSFAFVIETPLLMMLNARGFAPRQITLLVLGMQSAPAFFGLTASVLSRWLKLGDPSQRSWRFWVVWIPAIFMSFAGSGLVITGKLSFGAVATGLLLIAAVKGIVGVLNDSMTTERTPPEVRTSTLAALGLPAAFFKMVVLSGYPWLMSHPGVSNFMSRAVRGLRSLPGRIASETSHPSGTMLVAIDVRPSFIVDSLARAQDFPITHAVISFGAVAVFGWVASAAGMIYAVKQLSVAKSPRAPPAVPKVGGSVSDEIAVEAPSLSANDNEALASTVPAMEDAPQNLEDGENMPEPAPSPEGNFARRLFVFSKGRFSRLRILPVPHLPRKTFKEDKPVAPELDPRRVAAEATSLAREDIEAIRAAGRPIHENAMQLGTDLMDDSLGKWLENYPDDHALWPQWTAGHFRLMTRITRGLWWDVLPDLIRRGFFRSRPWTAASRAVVLAGPVVAAAIAAWFSVGWTMLVAVILVLHAPIAWIVFVASVHWIGRHYVLPGSLKNNAAILETMQRAEADGIRATFVLAGEEVTTPAQADRMTDENIELIQYLALKQKPPAADGKTEAPSIQERRHTAVKLSALQPKFNLENKRETEAAVDGMVRRVTRIAQACRQANIFLELDGELYSWRDIQFTVLERVLRDNPGLRGWLGLAVQSYFTDTGDFVKRVIDLAGKFDTVIGVRLVKGAYYDAEKKMGSPVYHGTAETAKSYRRTALQLFKAGGVIYPMFASMNPREQAYVFELAKALRVEPTAWESQMLQGMMPRLAQRLVERGQPLRLYFLFGSVPAALKYFARRRVEITGHGAISRDVHDPNIPVEKLARVDPVFETRDHYDGPGPWHRTAPRRLVLRVITLLYETPWVRPWLLRFAAFVTESVYGRVRLVGWENVPKDGPFVLIFNHPTGQDGQHFSPPFWSRGIHLRPLVTESQYDRLEPFFRLVGAIRVQGRRPAAQKSAAQQEANPERERGSTRDGALALVQGQAVALAPDGEITPRYVKDGKLYAYPVLLKPQSGAWAMALEAEAALGRDVPLIMAFMEGDGFSDHIFPLAFSREGIVNKRGKQITINFLRFDFQKGEERPRVTPDMPFEVRREMARKYMARDVAKINEWVLKKGKGDSVQFVDKPDLVAWKTLPGSVAPRLSSKAAPVLRAAMSPHRKALAMVRAANLLGGGRWPWLVPFYNRAGNFTAQWLGRRAGKFVGWSLLPALVETAALAWGFGRLLPLVAGPPALSVQPVMLMAAALVLWEVVALFWHTAHSFRWSGRGLAQLTEPWSKAFSRDTLLINGLSALLLALTIPLNISFPAVFLSLFLPHLAVNIFAGQSLEERAARHYADALRDPQRAVEHMEKFFALTGWPSNLGADLDLGMRQFGGPALVAAPAAGRLGLLDPDKFNAALERCAPDIYAGRTTEEVQARLQSWYVKMNGETLEEVLPPAVKGSTLIVIPMPDIVVKDPRKLNDFTQGVRQQYAGRENLSVVLGVSNPSIASQVQDALGQGAGNVRAAYLPGVFESRGDVQILRKEPFKRFLKEQPFTALQILIPPGLVLYENLLDDPYFRPALVAFVDETLRLAAPLTSDTFFHLRQASEYLARQA